VRNNAGCALVDLFAPAVGRSRPRSEGLQLEMPKVFGGVEPAHLHEATRLPENTCEMRCSLQVLAASSGGASHIARASVRKEEKVTSHPDSKRAASRAV